MNDLWPKIEGFLPEITRPGRYAGNEVNAVRKKWEDTGLHFALAFPDLYEIGMSNLGMEILYHVLNRESWIAAERVYSPWIDMEKKLRELELPLFSLESRRPLVDFDILGVSLQYELQYTNVLNLIDLGGIPLHAEERDDRHPLVIAGGPCAFNPEPLAAYLDGVVLGDGEEAVLEICRTAMNAKKGGWDRRKALLELSRIPGVYVPSLYRPVSAGGSGRTAPVLEGVPERIGARILASLDSSHYSTHPLVPLIEITHDRYSLEIMRGCTRGCRFCHAGMVYRPVRERPVDELISLAEQVIISTGYEEVSLVSLSTSDYSRLMELLKGLQNVFRKRSVSLSFPSLRPDTFTPEMAEFATDFRRSGLTLAPEAGTQRLRDVINKNNCEEDLLRAVGTAFEKGWKQVKLYFMIGLPTETEEDIQGIVDLVGRTVELARKHGSREIHVSISPFSPKPHTPFQWESQSGIEELLEKTRLIRMGLRKWKEVKVSWRDPSITILETILGRGDRALGSVIEEAWRTGTRFDAWTDLFDMERWKGAFQKTGISPETYLAGKEPGSPLPWGHLSKGIPETYLEKERERACRGQVTGDCRTGPCNGCGLEHYRRKGPSVPEKTEKTEIREAPSPGPREASVSPFKEKVVLRLKYRKGEEVRFTSHLDTLRILMRSFRRADLKMAYSHGFHAHPRISAGPPLALGYTSRSEYIDVELVDRRADTDAVNRALPAGMEILESLVLPVPPVSLGQFDTACYSVTFPGALDATVSERAIGSFLNKKRVIVRRKRGGKEKDIDIRHYVDRLSINGGTLEMELLLTPSGTARVEEVLQSLFETGEEMSPLRIERTGLFITRMGKKSTPMELN